MMRYKGASYSPGDLAPGKNGIKCQVVLLDGKAEFVEIHVSTTAHYVSIHERVIKCVWQLL